MKLDSRQILKVLQERGVNFLYHANTLTTSCTFLQEGALLSRGAVQKRHLAQTSQSTDSSDKKFRIWNDVFLDTVDIHARAGKRNFYGPILFLIDVQVLGTSVKSVWITKKNPANWVTREKKSERFYSSVEEFRASYNVGDFGAMIMLRDVDGTLPLKGVLRKIVIDEPGTQFDIKGKTIEASNYAIKVLRTAAKESGLKGIRIEHRNCSEWCGCHDQYRREPLMVKAVFALQQDDEKVHLHLW